MDDDPQENGDSGPESSDTENDEQSTDETTMDDDSTGDDADDDSTDDSVGTEDQHFEGSGIDLIPDVRVTERLIIAEISHDGSEDFRMTLVNDEYVNYDLIRDSGSYSGKRAVQLGSSERREDTRELDVDADGNWELTIRQPRPEEGEPFPAQATGSGPDVIGPYEFTGAHTVTATHDGESNFQMIVYPLTGDPTEIVINTIGKYDGEQEFTFLDTGFVEINADGDWSVDIE